MDTSDVIAVLALLAALITVPAAVIAYRNSRQEDRATHFTKTLGRLQNEQVALNALALDQSPASWKPGDLPLLSREDWILESPIDIRSVDLRLDPGQKQLDLRRHHPLSSRGRSQPQTYAELVRSLGGMNELFNGRIYRLMDVGSNLSRMDFAMARYFDYLDTGEVLAFESAGMATGRRGRILTGAYRKSLGNPFRLTNRVASLGINTLTIRIDGSRAGFFLHERDPSRVAVDSSLIGVAPAGEFTPSDRTLESIDSDFSLWRNIMREYAEEYLGEEEAKGQGGRWIDYGSSSPYVELQRGLDEGTVRCWLLGLGLDPLSWKPEMLSVCVIDGAVFDDVFAQMLLENDEGRLLVGPHRKGMPFDEATVTRYLIAEETAPSTKACLTLAWRHRERLGLPGYG